MDDDDLLGKADALLRRHVPPRPAADGAGEVPLLTELITPGTAAAAGPDEGATVLDEPVPAPEAGAPPLPPAPPSRELVAEIVSAVEARLARDLEERVARQVSAQVDATVAGALESVRKEIAEAVAAAVTDALSRHPQR